jgi:hypothetical protein
MESIVTWASALFQCQILARCFRHDPVHSVDRMRSELSIDLGSNARRGDAEASTVAWSA